jgi:hypothetical protein
MKKTIALFSSLLIFAGLKAQTTTPAVKKETVKPGTVQPPVLSADSIRNAALKQTTNKVIKYDHIKKTPETVQLKDAPAQIKKAPVQMKESPVAKPQKG